MRKLASGSILFLMKTTNETKTWTTKSYNSNGDLVSVESRTFVVDADGFTVAEINADGSVTEYESL